MKYRFTRWFAGIIVLLCICYLLLLIPDTALPPVPDTVKQPFAWDSNEYWSLLENKFQKARAVGCDGLADQISSDLTRIDSLLIIVESDTFSPDAPLFTEMETAFFELSVVLAACPLRLPEYANYYSRLRKSVKNQSAGWDMNAGPARDRIYRLLYGCRTAIEEIILQSPEHAIPGVIIETEEPSATPSAEILGVTVHSGDILISRGGAPTSALIARGNDYPGNFSHAALLHIDKNTGAISIIESHIEMGVAVAAIDDYFRDTKLRVMILRLRSNLPAMRSDPMLPHKAAEHALQRAFTEHIPYDFTMDTGESSRLFCSEVVSDAYRHVGIRLWSALSHISSPGVKSWLATFGVKHFTTQEPSDLEYDSQIRVVAEWRDHETLYKDHLDNAVVDVMLEGADRGDQLDYDWYMLPTARIARLYSMILNLFGGIGPIPEGMNATAALQNEWFSQKHRKIKEQLITSALRFKEQNGYTPPYWALVDLARKAAAEYR